MARAGMGIKDIRPCSWAKTVDEFEGVPTNTRSDCHGCRELLPHSVDWQRPSPSWFGSLTKCAGDMVADLDVLLVRVFVDILYP